MIICVGCQDVIVSRDRLNEDVRQVSIEDVIKLTVVGASIMAIQNTGQNRLDQDIPEIQIRAQSLDVRLDVETNSCRPIVLHVSLDQLPVDDVSVTSQAFLDAVSAQEEATRNVAGLFLSSPDPQSDILWTPISPQMETNSRVWSTAADSGQMQWTLCIKRGLGFYRELPGHRPRIDCEFPGGDDPPGACAGPLIDGVDPVISADMVVRYRVKRHVVGPFEFAIWGSDDGDAVRREKLMKSINESNALFAIVNEI